MADILCSVLDVVEANDTFELSEHFVLKSTLDQLEALQWTWSMVQEMTGEVSHYEYSVKMELQGITMLTTETTKQTLTPMHQNVRSMVRYVVVCIAIRMIIESARLSIQAEMIAS